MKAFSLLRRRNAVVRANGLKLVIVGKITDVDLERELHELHHQLELGGDLIWAGHQENEEASTFCRGSDVAVLPFDQGVRLNNSSFAVCAVHGLPIITTAGEYLEPEFRDQENVFLCEPRSPNALAAAIERLIIEPALRAQLHRGALALAASVFSWERSISETIEVIASASRPT